MLAAITYTLYRVSDLVKGDWLGQIKDITLDALKDRLA